MTLTHLSKSFLTNILVLTIVFGPVAQSIAVEPKPSDTKTKAPTSGMEEELFRRYRDVIQNATSIEELPQELRDAMSPQIIESLKKQYAAKALPKFFHTTSGNIGFMLGMYTEMMLSAYASGDPAMVSAANSAFGELGGWLSLFAFSIGAEKTGSFLGHISQSKFNGRGKMWIPSLGLVGGSLANSAFSKVWYHPSRAMVWRDVKGIGSELFAMTRNLNFSDLEVYGWGQKAQKVEILERQKQEAIMALFANPKDPILQTNLQKIDTELAELQPLIRILQEKFFENLHGFFMGTVGLPTGKGALDFMVHGGQLVVLSAALSIFRKVYQVPMHLGSRGLYSAQRGLVKKIMEEVVKIPAEQLPMRWKVLNGTLTFLTEKGQIVGKNIIVRWGGAALVSAVHGLQFLLGDKYLFGPAVNQVWSDINFSPNKLKNNVRTKALNFLSGKNVRALVHTSHGKIAHDPNSSGALNDAGNAFQETVDENNLLGLQGSIEKFISGWNEYTNKTILKEYNERFSAWQRELDFYDITHTKRLNHFRWLMDSYILGRKSGKAYNWVNFGDENFRKNGGTSITSYPWHEETIRPEFIQDLQHYRAEFDKYFKLKILDEKGKDRGTNEKLLRASLHQVLLDFQVQHDAWGRLASGRLHHYLGEKIEEALLTNQSGAFFINLGKLRGAKYNIRDVLIEQFYNIKDTYLSLNIAPSESSPLATRLKQILENNPYPDKNLVDDFMFFTQINQLVVGFKDQSGKELLTLSSDQRKDVVAYQIARLLSFLWVEYKNLEKKKLTMIRDPNVADGQDLELRRFRKQIGVSDPFGTQLSFDLSGADTLTEKQKTDVRDVVSAIASSKEKADLLDMFDAAGELESSGQEEPTKEETP